MKRLPNVLWAICFAGFLAIAFAPATSRIVREQIVLSVPTDSATAQWCIHEQEAMGVATSHSGHVESVHKIGFALAAKPNDLELRIGAAELLRDNTSIQNIVARIGGSPTVDATVIALQLSEIERDSGPHTRPVEKAPQIMEFPILELAVQDGEKLEPKNAYFPFAHATLEYRFGKSAEAQRDFVEALSLPDWNAHLRERSSGVEELLQSSFPGMPYYLEFMDGSDRPDFQFVNAVWKAAVAYEGQGEFRKAVQLRLALNRLSTLILLHNRSESGWSYARFFSRLACEGARLKGERVEEDQYFPRLRSLYAAHGMADVVAMLGRQRAMFDQVIWSADAYSRYIDFLDDESFLWVFCPQLLGSFLVVVLLGALCEVVGRSPWVREGRALQRNSLFWMIPAAALLYVAIVAFGSWETRSLEIAVIWGIFLDSPVGLRPYPAILLGGLVGLSFCIFVGVVIFALVRKRPLFSVLVGTLNFAFPLTALFLLAIYATQLRTLAVREQFAARLLRENYDHGLQLEVENAGGKWPSGL